MLDKNKIDFEVRVLERWLKVHKKGNETEAWYKDARDCIQALRKILDEA